MPAGCPAELLFGLVALTMNFVGTFAAFVVSGDLAFFCRGWVSCVGVRTQPYAANFIGLNFTPQALNSKPYKPSIARRIWAMGLGQRSFVRGVNAFAGTTWNKSDLVC